RYIAARGTSAKRETAPQSALTALSSYVQTQISSRTDMADSYAEQNGAVSSSVRLEQQTLIQTETELFAVRYTDPWWNPAIQMWEMIASIDRDEAWALFEPRLSSRTAPFMAVFEAAERDPEPLRQFLRYKAAEGFDAAALRVYLDFARTLNPVRAAAFDPVRQNEWRDTWVKTLNEAAAFFKAHPPFEIIYDSALTQGNINYAKETVDISFNAVIAATAGFKIISDLDQGFAKTGRNKGWKDSAGISFPGWGISIQQIYDAMPTRYTVSASLINENGERIGTTSWSWEPQKSYNFSYQTYKAIFSGVNANKITDKLTVSITEVNGMNSKTAGERSYISIVMGKSSRDFGVDLSFAEAKIVKYQGNSSRVVIPETILGRPVMSIGASAFANNQLISIDIPGSVTSIGESAFANNKLDSVTISNGVMSIGVSAFRGNQLRRVIIPDSVTSIGAEAFHDNNRYNSLSSRIEMSLHIVTLPANVQLGKNALPCGDFYQRNGKKAGKYLYRDVRNPEGWSFITPPITIPNGTTSIRTKEFANKQLGSVDIPGSVTSIGEEAFYGNQLASVDIPSSVTSIGERAFASNKLIRITIPNGVTSIGEGAFATNKLTSVTIPSSVTSIGAQAFAGNYQLYSVILPANVQLGKNALPVDCMKAYKKNRKKAGGYTSNGWGVPWKYQK
ncbi:MAG: leucine-rich repeat domain-containing protein, partial [Treponema sp.]|nr:leucine-rich repeat domain-containing protein [Treponema sp.]